MPTSTPPPTTINPSETSPSSDYDTLISLLHPHPTQPHQIPEIEILPSSHPSHILSAPPSIGIPKKTLLSCFLHARTIFLSHTLKQPCPESGRIRSEDEAWRATKVLTLWEPNWNTAWTFRKRALLSLRDDDDGNVDGGESGKMLLVDAVGMELAWVEILVRSPLDGKHAKSSWVWAHRMWILRTFFGAVAGEKVKGVFGSDQGRDAGCLVTRELKIVMVAAERHARNYYAWEYARQVLRMCVGTIDTTNARSLQVGEPGEEVGVDVVNRRLDRKGWEECTRMIHQWCLMHPRDISGWAFLVFMMDQRPRFGGLSEGDNPIAVDQITRDIFEKTSEFVNKFNWKGESIEWFLKSASHFQIDSND
ncbi:MAG: hypothetical protein Q9178_002428 [Gyalolechia marmorata]